MKMIFESIKDLHAKVQIECNKIHRQVQFIISKQRILDLQSNQVKLIDSISQFGEMTKSIISSELTLLSNNHLHKMSCYI